MRPAPLVLLLALAAALPASAQDEVDPDELAYAGVLANGPAIPANDARNGCPEFPVRWIAAHPRADELQPACDTDGTGELERTGDRRWFWTRYRWTTMLPPDHPDAEPADTVVEEEVVLFSAPLDRDELTAEWHARYPVSYLRGVSVETGPTDGGGALLAVLSCWNGTGGCRQHFLLRDAAGWRPVRDAWMGQLPDEFAGTFWKGSYINPMTLQGQASVYGRDDGNCCPSRVLYFRVRLEGDALVLRDHRVVQSPYN
jgi:hypothetical protein